MHIQKIVQLLLMTFLQQKGNILFQQDNAYYSTSLTNMIIIKHIAATTTVWPDVHVLKILLTASTLFSISMCKKLEYVQHEF